MAQLSLSRAWEESRRIFARDGRLLVAVGLALVVLPQAALGAFTPSTPAEVSASFYGLLMVVMVTAVIAQIALNRLAIPPDATVGLAIGRGAQRLLPALIALFLAFALITLVFIVLVFLLIAAGLVAAPTAGAAPPLELVAILLLSMLAIYGIFQLVIPVAAAEPGGPVRLLRRAWALSKSNYWRLVAFLTIVWVGMLLFWALAQLLPGLAIAAVFGAPESGDVGAMVVALVAAIVQAAWTIVTSVMLARMYVQLAGAGDAEVSVPSTGT